MLKGFGAVTSLVGCMKGMLILPACCELLHNPHAFVMDGMQRGHKFMIAAL